MARQQKHGAADSGDDSDTPEAVSFGASRKTARGEHGAIQRFHAEEKMKAKEKNRARDRAMKARAESAKVAKGKAVAGGRSAKRARIEEEDAGSGEDEEGTDSGEDDEQSAAGGPSKKELEARMARAMMDAEDEEEDEDEDFEEGSAFGDFSGEDDELEGDGEEGEEFEDDEDGDEDPSNADEDEDEDMASESEEEVDDYSPAPSHKPNYLPDHLFKSALSNAATKGSKIRFDDDLSSRAAPPPQRKRKRTKTSKDIVLGYVLPHDSPCHAAYMPRRSRVIRTLSNPTGTASTAATKGLARPRKMEKFVKKSLNVKGDASKSKSKGWTRRPGEFDPLQHDTL